MASVLRRSLPTPAPAQGQGQARLLRTVETPQRHVQPRRPLQYTPIRTYGDKAEASSSTPAHDPLARIPLYILGAAAVFFPFYYYVHSGKPPRSEQATVEQLRRERGTEHEYRDPRDTPIKTLERKKKAEEIKSSKN
ncbi:hypothetical protein PV08_04313 [Exophiala spinifera]|uniref:Uncharacterized protein n=1 Tax=Exophiala spinifera TaxID=91928 RepID=A0A0D1ZWR5_9EURO|nr:uncharacterized protein PV08_04313 [Exophiala spinifera]KIW17122.1 hypothetical protein PV08_04313 [Exophiala spinifera]